MLNFEVWGVLTYIDLTNLYMYAPLTLVDLPVHVIATYTRTGALVDLLY